MDPTTSRAMGERARDAFERHYDRAIAFDRVMTILEDAFQLSNPRHHVFRRR